MLFQLTISVDKADLLRKLATIIEILVKGDDAFANPDVINATDWYLAQLADGIGSHLDHFDDDELTLLAAYLRRTATTLESYKEVTNA